MESVVDYAIFLLDADGIVRTWNRGAERLKGYTADEIIGRHYSTFYPEQDREHLPPRLLGEARRSGRARHSGWRVRKDGSRFWADVVITALYDEDGVLHGFGKVTRDMTDAHRTQELREEALVDQRRAVARLEYLDEWRQHFIRSITHDLQSPVTGIAGFADLALEDGVPAGERRDLLERIRSNARSLQSMIDHLRTYALVESGRIELRPEPVVLAGFVDSLVADMWTVLAERRVETAVDPDIVADVDPGGLERILRNLLTNAARHTGRDDRILVTALREEHGITVSVRDTGEGIASDLVPRVFDRFQRGPHGRTGLGLSIVREYVELHGGRVWCDSDPGEGATFSFTLPVTTTAPPD